MLSCCFGSLLVCACLEISNYGKTHPQIEQNIQMNVISKYDKQQKTKTNKHMNPERSPRPFTKLCGNSYGKYEIIFIRIKTN